MKMNGFVLEENSSFNMLGLLFSSKLNSRTYIISSAKTVAKRLLCISINLPYNLT